MKKIIQLLCLIMITGVVKSQNLNISTSYKEICNWNPATSDFDQCGDNAEFASMFTLNADETMFNHTTSTIKSAYYVTKKEYSSTCSCYEYDVTSDVGNKYTFIVDLDHNMVKILSSGHDNAKDDYLITFTVKSHWKD